MSDFLNQLCGEVCTAFTTPLVLPIGSKKIVFPVPSVPTGAPANLALTKGSFPDGGITLKEFVALLPENPLGSLPPPLDTVLPVELDGISVTIDTKEKVVALISITVGLPQGTKIGVKKNNISNLALTLFVGLPTDPSRSFSAWISGDIELCGFAATTTISTDGHVAILLNEGNPIDTQAVLQEFATVGGIGTLPFSVPKLEQAMIEFDLPFSQVRLSSNFQGATLKFLSLEATLLSLGCQITDPMSCWATAEASIGDVRASGVFTIPGEITITTTIPSLSPAKLVAQAIPELADACGKIEGITFEDTQITFTKLTGEQHQALFSSPSTSEKGSLSDAIEARDGAVLKAQNQSVSAIGTDGADSLAVSTTIDITGLLPAGTTDFLGKVKAASDLTKIHASMMLTDSPLMAQIQFAILPTAIDLIPNSSYKLDGFWLQANLATSPSLALAAGVSFPFKDQIFELYGTVSVSAVEAKITAQLIQPKVWSNALGIPGLDVSGIAMEFGWSFDDDLPTVGIAGSFSVMVPHTGKRFAGGVVFIVDCGNPGATVFGVNFNHFDLCEAYHLFLANADPSLDRLLREVAFDDCDFYVAPEATTIGTATFPEGMIVRGNVDLFGWKAHVDVEVHPGSELKFECDIESPIRIGKLLQITGSNSSNGPHLDFTTAPAPGKPYLTAAAHLSIAGAFSAGTTIMFSQSAFTFTFTDTFFQTAAVKFTADADFANFSSGGFDVTLSLTGLASLASGITADLRKAAAAAKGAIGAAEQKVSQAERALKPIADERTQRQGVLNQLIKERDKAPWWKKPYYESQIVVVQGEVTSCDTAYYGALETLKLANSSLSAAETVENVALNTIAGFIDSIPIEIKSVTCTESLSALGQSEFTATASVTVDRVSHHFQIKLNFNLANMLETLGKDIYQAVVNLYKH
ncbi:hypothetical protein [Sedimenticola sp.]|uniref:hypothetical protein n=1 Tax=Sedimenticola sp. TaxID=1940285 RepID=UPI003D13EDEA